MNDDYWILIRFDAYSDSTIYRFLRTRYVSNYLCVIRSRLVKFEVRLNLVTRDCKGFIKIWNNLGKEIGLLGFALFEDRSLKFELIYAKR